MKLDEAKSRITEITDVNVCYEEYGSGDAYTTMEIKINEVWHFIDDSSIEGSIELFKAGLAPDKIKYYKSNRASWGSSTKDFSLEDVMKNQTNMSETWEVRSRLFRTVDHEKAMNLARNFVRRTEGMDKKAYKKVLKDFIYN